MRKARLGLQSIEREAERLRTLLWGGMAPFLHNLLSSAHNDTSAAAVVQGDMVTGQAGPVWARLAIGAADTHLESDGTDIAWQTNLTMADDAWIGFSGGGRLVFDSTPSPDQVEVTAADLYIATTAHGIIHVDGVTDGQFLRADGTRYIPDTLDVDDLTDLAYAVPAFTLGTANAVGSADTVVRSDATIAIFDATVPNVIECDDAAATGAAAVAARRDHEHGIVCAAPSANLTVGTSNAEGVATSFGRSDHSHAITSSSNPGAAASILASDISGYLQLVGLGIGTAASAADSITFADDAWEGLGPSAGRLIFDSTPTPDEIRLADCVLDLNGIADVLVLDADGDTTISSPTDDQIDFEIAGADDFTMTANSFNVLSGSYITFADDAWEGLGAAAGRLVWDSTAAPDTATFLACNVGIGMVPGAMAGDDENHLMIGDTTVNTTLAYYGIRNAHTKTAGATDHDDHLYGLGVSTSMDQSGGEIGHCAGIINTTDLTDGNVGDAVNSRNLYGIDNRAYMYSGADHVYGDFYGMRCTATVSDGEVHDDLFGAYMHASLGASGQVDDDIFGSWVQVGTDAGGTVTGDIYGMYITVDDDATAGGTVYMLYLKENTGIEYGVYQDGSADNYFGGDVGINTTSPSAKMHANQDAAAVTATATYAGMFSNTSDAADEVWVALQGGTAADVGIVFGDTDDENAGIFKYENSENQFYWRAGGSANTLEFDSGGDLYPGNPKNQDLGTATNEWNTVFYVSLSAGTSRLVDATRDCPNCAARMKRGTGTVMIRGEDRDYALAFCPTCGCAAMEEWKHLSQADLENIRPTPKMVLENLRVKTLGHSRQVMIDFRYGDDVIDGDGDIVERAIRNSTPLGEGEFIDFLTMSDGERLAFLKAIGQREWEAREETRIMGERIAALQAQFDAKVSAWLHKNLLLL